MKSVYRFYKFNGMCLPIPEDCRDYNRENGECLKCYTGTKLINGKCLHVDFNCN